LRWAEQAEIPAVRMLIKNPKSYERPEGRIAVVMLYTPTTAIRPSGGSCSFEPVKWQQDTVFYAISTPGQYITYSYKKKYLNIHFLKWTLKSIIIEENYNCQLNTINVNYTLRLIKN
jgi:hypothetical protein